MYHPVRTFCKFKGKYAVHGACCSKETIQILQHCSSLPYRDRGPWSHTGTPPTLTGSDLGGYLESGISRLHTHSEQHVHSSSTDQESAREGLYLLKQSWATPGPVRGNSRLWPTVTGRDFLLLGKVMHIKNHSDSVLQCGCHTETF